MTDLRQRIAKLLSGDEPVLVGVSGGVDSMVLMHLLAQRRGVHVAHLNHRLRGRSSDADGRLVQRSAEKLGLTCHIEKADVKAMARAQRLSLEMAARKCRHEFYARLARKLGLRRIALAHHADDQVELFFLRLLRGAGPEGLAGMSQVSPSFVDPALTIIRPLLGATKAELRAYAAEHKIPFREDATNASISILRNRIRHKLIPLLVKDYQPGLTQTVLRVMELLRAESDFITREGERPREPFHKLPIALQRRRLQQQLYAAGLEPTFDLIEHLRLHPGTPITVSPEHTIARDSSGALQTVADRSADSLSASVDLSLRSPGSTQFGPLTLTWSTATKSGKPAKNREYFDADKIGDSIILRHWRPGDRFQPIGMPASVKLQDLFTNLKVPRPRRHRLVVATTTSGDIFWVEGLRIGEKFKLGPGTMRRLKWAWRRHETF